MAEGGRPSGVGLDTIQSCRALEFQDFPEALIFSGIPFQYSSRMLKVHSPGRVSRQGGRLPHRSGPRTCYEDRFRVILINLSEFSAGGLGGRLARDLVEFYGARGTKQGGRAPAPR